MTPPPGATAVADAIEAAERSGLNAVLSFDRAAFLDRAARPVDGPLAGTAVAVKDNICTLREPTTCASRMLEGYRSPYAATVADRLEAAGAVIACKTNLDEFAMGASTEHSAFGRTRHPDDPTRVPGGSSGGSAALVAVGAVEVALGSETGGSVRHPAAFCGVVGLKPTYGRVSRFGLVAFGSSLDQVGVLASSVRRAGEVLAVIAGRDPKDATCAAIDAPAPPAAALPADLAGWTVGMPVEYQPAGLEPGVRVGLRLAADRLRDAGASVRDVSLPHTALALPAYYVIAPAEASANLARFDGARYGLRAVPPGATAEAMFRASRGRGFGAEVRRRILIGTFVLSAGYYEAYYGRATRARARVAGDFDRVFASGIDLLLTPTTPTTAFRAGEKLADPVAMYRTDAFVSPANLAGVPAVSLPAGRSRGLPVGVQLIAKHFDEERLLHAARVLESRCDPAAELA